MHSPYNGFDLARRLLIGPDYHERDAAVWFNSMIKHYPKWRPESIKNSKTSFIKKLHNCITYLILKIKKDD